MTPTARILIVDVAGSLTESDPPQENVVSLLTRRGYDVESVTSAREVDEALARHSPDVIVLDIGLPDSEVVDMCANLRRSSGVPIIVLSRCNGAECKIAALDEGADDYISKPFNPGELVARMRAALRRGPYMSDTGRLDRGGLAIDFGRRRILVGTREIRLTPKGFELLVYLARHPNAVVPHRAILAAIWGDQSTARPAQLWALVTKVRKRIEPDPDHPRYLLSEPWVGYRLSTEIEKIG